MSWRARRRLPCVHPFPCPAGGADRSRLRLELRAPLAASEGDRACEHVRMLLAAGGTRLLVCDVHGTADLGLVDVLARLTLTARRAGARMRVRSATTDLAGLLRLTGLDDQVRPD